jgi:perosamine synthetase
LIPYGRQSLNQNDIDSVVEVLSGAWLTQGPVIERFEQAVAEYVHAEYAVAFSSGTAALHGAAWAGGLERGDISYTSPLTFMATANAARYVGATPGLVDISLNTWNIDLSLLPAGTRAVFPVHYAGLPVNLNRAGWARRPRLVVEDAAHALGALTPDGPVGNCAHSDMTCFSFHPVKPITTGEGGMVTTNEKELADRLRLFRSHGIEKKPEKGGVRVEHIGYTYLSFQFS